MSNETATLRFVIPSEAEFPTSPLSLATTYVVLPKENHIQLTKASTFDREAEGSAVPQTTHGNVFQHTHPHTGEIFVYSSRSSSTPKARK
jgi:hypothetical protein